MGCGLSTEAGDSRVDMTMMQSRTFRMVFDQKPVFVESQVCLLAPRAAGGLAIEAVAYYRCRWKFALSIQGTVLLMSTSGLICHESSEK